jgi:hypothetical protein
MYERHIHRRSRPSDGPLRGGFRASCASGPGATKAAPVTGPSARKSDPDWASRICNNEGGAGQQPQQADGQPLKHTPLWLHGPAGLATIRPASHRSR